MHTPPETQTMAPTPTTPLVAVLLPPSLPGTFAEPGHGDHGRDHHTIIFIGTTQQLLLFITDCLRSWLRYNILHILLQLFYSQNFNLRHGNSEKYVEIQNVIEHVEIQYKIKQSNLL